MWRTRLASKKQCIDASNDFVCFTRKLRIETLGPSAEGVKSADTTRSETRHREVGRTFQQIDKGRFVPDLCVRNQEEVLVVVPPELRGNCQ
jgi:hypothetical protein